jgi:hypothetical protein
VKPILLLCAVLSAARLAAQDTRPVEGPTSRPLAEVVADLDAEDFARREAAAAELLRTGASAKDALVAARASGSLELRLRIDDLLAQLGGGAPASRPARLATATFRDATLEEAAAELGRAFGRRVRTATAADASLAVDVSLKDAAFFPALDAVCAAAGATFYRDARDGAYVLRSAPQEKPGPVAYRDGLRAALTQISVTRSRRFGGPASSSSYVQIQIDVEPGAPIVGVLAPVYAASAIDDRDRELASKDRPPPSYVQRTDQTGRLPVAAPLAAPEADAKTIKKLRFDLKVVVPERTEEVEVPRPGESVGTEHGVGAVRVVVEEWRTTETGVSVRVALERPTPQGDAPPGPALFDDRFEFVTASGETVEPRSTGTKNQVGKAQFVAELPPGDYAALRVSCLVRFAVRDVPVSFEEVPLP